MQTIRFGILGAAAIARETLIPAMQEARGVACAGLASQRPGVAARVAAELGIPLAFDSYQAMLESPEIDAVYIPLANGQHREWTERAAAHGKHILCEKPIAVTGEEAASMFATAERHGVRLMEAFAYHFHPQYQRLWELVAEERFGEPVQVRARISFPLLSFQKSGQRRDLRLDPQAGGAGVLLDHGCYAIHAARRIFKTDPVAVLAHQVLNEDGVDIATSAILEFPGGKTAVFDTHFDSWIALDMEVLGRSASVRLPRGFGRPAPGTQLPVEIWRRGQKPETETIPFVEPAVHMVEHFADLVRDPALPAFTPAAESLAVMRVIDACFESARTGRRVSL